MANTKKKAAGHGAASQTSELDQLLQERRGLLLKIDSFRGDDFAVEKDRILTQITGHSPHGGLADHKHALAQVEAQLTRLGWVSPEEQARRQDQREQEELHRGGYKAIINAAGRR